MPDEALNWYIQAQTHSTPPTHQMPHTSRPNSKSNKSKAKKRLQVTDSTGWTHVTTTNLSRAVPKAKASDENEDEVDLPPAEPPTNLTLSALETQFARHHERFLASDCWRTISNTVCRALTQTQLDHLVVVSLALGSPSGFLRGGWVDRRAVSMDQVVALVCIRDMLRTSPPCAFICTACLIRKQVREEM